MTTIIIRTQAFTQTVGLCRDRDVYTGVIGLVTSKSMILNIVLQRSDNHFL